MVIGKSFKKKDLPTDILPYANMESQGLSRLVCVKMGVNGARKCVKVTLNINEVKNAKPKADSYHLTDANGLSLQISPLGTKTWHYRYRHKGLPKTLTLGRYPEVGLAAARLARDDARRVVLAGKDPSWERKRQRQEELRGAQATFRKLGDEWLEEHEPLWSKANAVRAPGRPGSPLRSCDRRHRCTARVNPEWQVVPRRP